MRFDERGVGGFAEDLPVMIFVLAGVCLLVGAAVSAAEKARTGESDELESLAEVLVSEVMDGFSVTETPTVTALRSFEIVNCAEPVLAGCDGWYVSLRSVHPEIELLQSSGSLPDQAPGATGSCSRLINACDDDMMIVVVEVRAVVW
ncbi:MAG: hypothetical protein MUE55_00060 [Thermoplasmata archaeon]|nr:hypothetical protein [Thermoplasmata archaeon]